MGKTVFFVYFSRDNWWVDFSGTSAGPYTTKAEAVASTVRRAEAVTTSGRQAEILAPDDDRRYERVWPLTPEREATRAV